MNDTTNLFLDILVIAAGLYLVYSAILMRLRGEIQGSLISRNIDLKNAPDKQGYIRVMFWPNLLAGVMLALCGITTSVLPRLGVVLPEQINTWVFLVALVVIMAYGILSMNAQNKYLR
ncbi:MAG: hypothetical protein K6F35_09190 [Lachnospiraceae bacterium]|nr:hypothetical protein [Lachnospiraceae bacterium]